MHRVLAALIAFVALASAATAQPQTSVSKTNIVTESAVIVAIDSTNRLITFKGENGMTETLYAGPEVQRFSELKVGDKVTFKFQESVCYAIQQPGDKPPAREKSAIVRNAGPRPGGTISQETTTVVTVQAIDLSVPSITVKTEKGEIMSFKVEDKANLTGVKVGNKVQVTYTLALAISVETPKR